jgi:hypothetical protein
LRRSWRVLPRPSWRCMRWQGEGWWCFLSGGCCYNLKVKSYTSLSFVASPHITF